MPRDGGQLLVVDDQNQLDDREFVGSARLAPHREARIERRFDTSIAAHRIRRAFKLYRRSRPYLNFFGIGVSLAWTKWQRMRSRNSCECPKRWRWTRRYPLLDGNLLPMLLWQRKWPAS